MMCTRRDEARILGARGKWTGWFTVTLQVVKSQVMFNLVGHNRRECSVYCKQSRKRLEFIVGNDKVFRV